MPQLSEVATFGPSLVNPYASTPDSIESRAWMLWRAAIGTAQRIGTPIGEQHKYGAEGLVFQIALRSVAKDLFAGVPGDLAAIYALLKDHQNAACLDRGSRGITPLWWFRAEFNLDEPIAQATQLPVEAPPLPEPKAAVVKRSAKPQTGPGLAQADQRTLIVKALAAADHPVYLEELAALVKLGRTTTRSRVMELIADERAFRRLETLEERDGTPGRRHHLYWGSPDIPVRPAELFKVSSRKSGNRPGYVAPARKTVLQRVEELAPGGMVSLSTASAADWVAIKELIDGGVIEYVDGTSRKEVRLTSFASTVRGSKPESVNEYVERNWSAATEQAFGGDVRKSDIDGGVTNLGAKLEAGLKALIEAEVARRIETRVANEVAELERRISESEAKRVEAQDVLAEFKKAVQQLGTL